LLIDEPADEAFALLRRYGVALAACLAAIERDRRGMVSRIALRLSRLCFSWRGRFFCLAAAAAALLLALPWTYRINCHCQVQPVVRRFVVAPYDGTLEKSLVSPGDVVSKGDVLARMDEREIGWELAGLRAEFTRAEKERDAAMASHKTSAAQLAELEMERLEVKMQLLEHRTDNLAIRSPIDGIVVAGDLEKAEGAPLTIGQTLFEVAPLETMLVEVNVPEEEIARVRREMSVNVMLNAFPDQPILGVLERIHPQAELRDNDSVFVADLTLDNPDGRLRPGMNGWAKVTGDRKSLGWILFHKPWSTVRRTLAW
jgi:RND family efflux transporter MFP subunit